MINQLFTIETGVSFTNLTTKEVTKVQTYASQIIPKYVELEFGVSSLKLINAEKTINDDKYTFGFTYATTEQIDADTAEHLEEIFIPNKLQNCLGSIRDKEIECCIGLLPSEVNLIVLHEVCNNIYKYCSMDDYTIKDTRFEVIYGDKANEYEAVINFTVVFDYSNEELNIEGCSNFNYAQQIENEIYKNYLKEVHKQNLRLASYIKGVFLFPVSVRWNNCCQRNNLKKEV